MTEREYLKRLDALKEKASEIGAEFEHSFYDKDHLDCFWYSRYGLATIEYKGYTVYFDVCGEINVAYYDGATFKGVFSKKNNARPLFENDDVREEIGDDETLREKTESGDLVFENNNWIAVAVVKDADEDWNLRFEPEIAGETNLLEAVENNFDYFVAFINKDIEKSN